MNSVKFICKCGKQESWVTDNEVNKNPCPNCGRIYKGIYNAKKLTIEAIEVKDKKYKNTCKYIDK